MSSKPSPNSAKAWHFQAVEELVAERGPDNKPFLAESLVMISDLASPKL